MHAIGAPVARRRLIIYMISAAFAGVSEALFAQTTQFVGLGTLNLARSGTVLIMLIIGGGCGGFRACVGAPPRRVDSERLLDDSPQSRRFRAALRDLRR